ncbi:uncharacterized protein PG998_012707 [Apiospora kogelbergensis]|uniref:Infection structure specific protein n=1 Tax=Apiospora kogelbergensis TaxID=1337665 RepID=A0AAW0Q5F6_9PEZI
MVNQVLLSAAVAGLASTVGATYNHAAANQLRDLYEPAQVVARQQSSGGDAACTQSAAKLIAGFPTPTGALVSYYATASMAPELTGTAIPTNLGQACAAVATVSVPQSLSAPLSQYEASLLGWYGSHTKDIEQLISACSAEPMVATAESLLNQITKEPACMSLLGSNTAALPTPSPTGANGGQQQSASPSPSKAAAPKPTAMAAGVVAAAGFIGAVAML